MIEQAKSRPMPPPPAKAATAKPTTRSVTFGGISKATGQRVVLYGPGGIGKTTLALAAPGPVAMYDLDRSLPVLQPENAPHVVEGVATWADLLATLGGDGWGGIKTIVIDSATMSEELCAGNVLATVPGAKGEKVTRIEDYGYGKGLTHVYDTFLKLLAALDLHVAAGRNVVLVAHECTERVPNPMGDDFLRYEPRLQSPGSGKNSIRLRVREWADHLLYVGYDIVAKDGKATGSGTRSIYPIEQPWAMAKSRRLADRLDYDRDNATELWNQILGL